MLTQTVEFYSSWFIDYLTVTVWPFKECFTGASCDPECGACSHSSSVLWLSGATWSQQQHWQDVLAGGSQQQQLTSGGRSPVLFPPEQFDGVLGRPGWRPERRAARPAWGCCSAACRALWAMAFQELRAIKSEAGDLKVPQDCCTRNLAWRNIVYGLKGSAMDL